MFKPLFSAVVMTGREDDEKRLSPFFGGKREKREGP